MRAKPIDMLTIRSAETLPNGVGVVMLDCANSDELARLPKAIEVDGVRYGRTGWNSDHCVAYYRTDAQLAKPLS